MGQIQQALQQGDGQKAADAMNQMAQQLDQMQQEMNEMEMLDAAMDQLEMAKDAMACEAAWAKAARRARATWPTWALGENMNGEPGMGMGAGRGIGPRPDEKNATNLRDTRCSRSRAAAPPRSAAWSKARTSRATWPKPSRKKWPRSAPSRPTRSPASASPTAAASTPSSISRCSAKASSSLCDKCRLGAQLCARLRVRLAHILCGIGNSGASQLCSHTAVKLRRFDAGGQSASGSVDWSNPAGGMGAVVPVCRKARDLPRSLHGKDLAMCTHFHRNFID